MKTTLFFLFAILTSQPALAVEPEVGGVEIKGDILKVSLKYMVQCEGKHDFKIEVGICTRSMPPQCNAKMVDITPPSIAQGCRRMPMQRADIYEYSLKAIRLHSGASMTIDGANGSSASFVVPTKQ